VKIKGSHAMWVKESAYMMTQGEEEREKCKENTSPAYTNFIPPTTRLHD